MTAVFISHASEDGPQSASVKVWLAEQGFENVFLDFDKSGGLKAGENWEKRLYEEVARCHTVILVVTPAWLSSKWCFAEFSMARSLGKTIFPILLRPDDIEIIGPELSSIQAEHWNEKGKSHLAERLNAVAHEIARGHTYTRDRPPYPGFLSFDEKDAAVFFGRDPEIREISERLEARRVQGGARLLMVVGPSGSGKSSLVKAGVLPWIGRDPQRWVGVPVFRPGDSPVSRLAKALAEALQASGEWKVLREGLIKAPSATLAEIAERLQVGKSREATILITVDQFEESFALTEGGEHDACLALFAEIGRGKLPFMLLVTVRSDLMGEILKSRDFSLPHEVFTLGKLPVERLPQVIEGPAQVAAIQLDRGLSNRIIEDAVSADALPLLAFALREMYDRYGSEGRLTIMHYEALGDASAGLSPLENAIRRKAEETIAAAAPSPVELDALKEAFVSGLVRVNAEGVRLRRTAEFDTLPGAARPLIHKLIGARLLTARGDGKQKTVEVAHEALFRAWPQLSTWLDDEQDFLVGCRHIEEARKIWTAAHEGQKDRALLSGLLLEKAREWTLRYPTRLNELHDFVAASIRKEEREQAHTRRLQVRLMMASVATAVVLAVLSVAALLQWGRADRAAELAALEAKRAQENELAAAAASRRAEDRFALALGAVGDGLADDDPRLALFLAGEAVLRAGDAAPGYYARAAMVRGRRALATDGPHVLGSPIPVGDALSIALSPAGDRLAVGDRNGLLSLIDTRTGGLAGEPLTGHVGGIEDLEFSPSGAFLASAGSAGEVRLWRIGDGQIRSGEVLGDFGDVAWSVGFDRSGTQLAATSEAGEVRLWDIGGGVPVAHTRLHTDDDMLSVAFNRGGDALLSGSGTGAIYGWKLAKGDPVFPTIEHVHNSDVWHVLFSPSGKQFASVSSDGSAALFDFPAGKFREYALDSTHMIRSAVFGPSGDVLIGGGEDGRLHVRYLAETGSYHQSAPGHAARISKTVLRRDGMRLATLGRDHTVRLWTLFDPVAPARDLMTEEPAKGVALSPDGGLAAGGDTTGRVHLWHLDGEGKEVFEGLESEVWAVALSPDGTRLAAADRAGGVRVWAVDDGAVSHSWKIGDGAVWWLAFAAGGTRLYAAGDDGLAALDLAADGAAPDWLLADERLSGGALSPDGKRLAATSMRGQVALLDTSTGALQRRVDVVDDIVWSAAFDPEGQRLAVASSDEVVSLWDVETGKLRAEFGGHSGGATDTVFLPDRATLAVTDRRGQLHLWDLVTERRLAPPIPAHDGASWRIAVHASENLFATSGDDGRIRVWDILDSRRACAVGASGFDRQRRLEYFGSEAGTLFCTAK